MRVIDGELLSLSAHALKNAYYRAHNNMLARYVQAGAGTPLDVYQLLESYGFGDVEKPTHGELIMYVDWPVQSAFGPHITWRSCGVSTVLEGLQDDRAKRLWINGRQVFEVRDGEWYYVEDLDQ